MDVFLQEVFAQKNTTAALPQYTFRRHFNTVRLCARQLLLERHKAALLLM